MNLLETRVMIMMVVCCVLLQDTEVLELQQQAAYRQQIQKLQQQEDEDTAQREEEATARAEAAAFAAANKAAAAAYQQQADAEAAAEAVVKRARAPAARAPAELFKFDVGLLDSDIPGHAQLMQVLMGFRQDMVEGLTGVTSTMQVCRVSCCPVAVHRCKVHASFASAWCSAVKMFPGMS
jgi:chemotaxis protein histidine kinase CheA